jgi:hypothetical protein
MAEEVKVTESETKAPETKEEPKEKTFTQAELDKIVEKRIAREKKKLPGDDELKAYQDWKDGQKKQESENMTNLQSKVTKLEAELASERVSNALNMALIGAGVTDTDYMAFKIKADNELTLDDQGNIDGIDTILESAKTAYPGQFNKTEKTADKKYIPNELKEGEGNKGITQEQFSKMGYQERNELFRSNPEQYYKLTGKK